MSFDAKDRHLLFLLEQNSRASLTRLAGGLRLSREAVNYRIKKLQDAGIIKSFIVETSFSRLGLATHSAYLKLSNLSASDYSDFLAKLSENRQIIWLASLGGRFDLTIETSASDIPEADSFFSGLLNEHAAYVRNCIIVPRVFEHAFGRKYLWPEKAPAEKKQNARPSGVFRPDALDVKILSALSSEARLPVTELGRRVGEAPSTVSYRLKQLEREGVIDGYSVFTQTEALGYSRFKSLITVREFSREGERKILAFCRTHPNVYYINKTLGSWNFEIEVDVQTPMEYQQFLLDFRSRFDSTIQEIESLSIFKEHVFKFWPY